MLKYLVTIFSIYSGIHVIQSNLLNRLLNYAILSNVTLTWVAPLSFISVVYLMLLSVSPPPQSDAREDLTSYDSTYSWLRFWPGTPLLQSAYPVFTYQPQTFPIL